MTVFEWSEAGLTAALDALGATPGEVADTLLAGGHRGRPGCDASCPVAEYLTAVFDGALTSVYVEQPDMLWAEVYRADRIPHRFNVLLPPVVAGFVAGFDRGGYADLDRTREAAEVAR